MPPQNPLTQTTECAGCGATDFNNRFWVPQSVPGVALCETCQFQQQHLQVPSNQIDQYERWENQVFQNNHGGLNASHLPRMSQVQRDMRKSAECWCQDRPTINTGDGPHETITPPFLLWPVPNKPLKQDLSAWELVSIIHLVALK
ncbi:unnamed protein product [Rodentolepis nana]|uniref:GATA-type domain-containing protein n=1 Tax=Rodentolepis nana TaxID=102285 RepID=A0A0R3TFZ1_RODNA|nr:unnamed protein product [Rodentolepis nana]